MMKEVRIWCKYCIHMYVNGKVIPVETIPEMGGGEYEGIVEGMHLCTIYLI
jgi:hypothetical protein